MLRKKLRKSLTVRICLLTCAILLAACAITFGLIAWATPITYTTVITDDLDRQAQALSLLLQSHPYDEARKPIESFIRRTGAVLTLVDPENAIVTDLSPLLSQTIGEDDATVAVTVTRGDTEVSDSTLQTGVQSSQSSSAAVFEWFTEDVDQFSIRSGTFYSPNYLYYTLSFPDREGQYSLHVSARTQAANQAVEALAKVAPWLLAVMVLFSALCAFFYSRYITRPIVRLSGIAQKMADLDFEWACGEVRSDEIGALGRSLDSLSHSLSSALGELRQANASLQQDIARERELEQQRLAFFSAVSHELKTPVTVLKGQLTGMLEGVDVYQDRDKYLARALQVTGRMERLIQEILTVSRIESSSPALQFRETALDPLVREALDLLAELTQEKALQVTLDLNSQAVVWGDSKLLSKVLGNILSNAVFYSPPGATIFVEVWQAGGRTQLSVENSGAHIPAASLPHLFEAFYRVEQSRSRRTGGSGLGLYLVKLILELHGAEYGIENLAGSVRFWVRFPRQQQQLPPAAPEGCA